MSNDSPNWPPGYEPTAEEWNEELGSKQDANDALDVLIDLNPGQIIGNAGSGVQPIVISTGLSLSASGTLTNSGLLVQEWTAGTVDAIAPSLTINGGGTLGLSGTIAQNVTFTGSSSLVVAGLINAGTIEVSGTQVAPTYPPQTINATAGQTITLMPLFGRQNVLINGPNTGGTVTIATAAATAGVQQEILVGVSNGATVTVFKTGANINVPSSLSPFTSTATPGARDEFVLFHNVGTVMDLGGITQGFSP